MSDSHTTNGGVGFFGLLTVALVVLKLTGYIAWSWWWVFSPLWIGALSVIVILGFILFIAVCVSKSGVDRI